jgi:uncharacterized protein
VAHAPAGVQRHARRPPPSATLAERASDCDAVVATGDLASVHRGLEQLIDVLAVIETPTVLVPRNNETDVAPRAA